MVVVSKHHHNNFYCNETSIWSFKLSGKRCSNQLLKEYWSSSELCSPKCSNDELQWWHSEQNWTFTKANLIFIYWLSLVVQSNMKPKYRQYDPTGHLNIAGFLSFSTFALWHSNVLFQILRGMFCWKLRTPESFMWFKNESHLSSGLKLWC